MGTKSRTPDHGSSWQPVDLSSLLTADYQKPRPTVGIVEDSEIEGSKLGMFYLGKVNTIFGDSGGGKSWLSLWVIAQQMLAGHHAILIDYEDDPITHIVRLRQMGVDIATIAKYFIYIQPTESWNEASRANLESTLKGRAPTVAVIDSFGEALAVDGMSANADEEVARWMRGCARFLASLGHCVVILDHIVKSNVSSRNSEFASGSHRKRASIAGAAYFLKVVKAPSRENDGHLQAIPRKERHGWWPTNTIAADIRITNLSNGDVSIRVAKPADASIKPKVFRPTVYMQRISAFLQSEGEPRSKTQIIDGVGGKFAALSAAIDRLVSEGYCSSTTGPRNAKLIAFVKPYEESTDPEYPEPF